MPYSPGVIYGTTGIAHPGHLKVASLGGVILPCESANISQQLNYQYTKYALTLPAGVRQKTLHSRGTKETTWSLSGDLFYESASITNLILPTNRGIYLTLLIRQGPLTERLDNCMIESFTLEGSADGMVRYNISGKSLNEVMIVGPFAYAGFKYTVPGWTSGNALVKSWSLSHQVGLTANWANNQNPLPTYYRTAESEYNLQLSTLVQPGEYDTVSIGIGTAAILTGLVTSRQVSYSGEDPKTYNCAVTNVSVQRGPSPSGFNPFVPALVAAGSGGPPADWI